MGLERVRRCAALCSWGIGDAAQRLEGSERMKAHPREGDVYLWADARWRVERVIACTPDNGGGHVVKIVNVDRPVATATLPITQFKDEAREPDEALRDR